MSRLGNKPAEVGQACWLKIGMKAGLFAVNRESYLGKSWCPTRVRPHSNLKIIVYRPVTFKVNFSHLLQN